MNELRSVFSAVSRFIRMRFIHVAASFAFVILVVAVPIRNLNNELLEAVDQTQTLIRERQIRALISAAQMILDNDLAEQPEIDMWKNLRDRLETQIESISRSDIQSRNLELELDTLLFQHRYKELNSIEDDRVDDKISDIGEKLDANLARILAQFQTRANEMIRLAKENGYNDDALYKVYDQFVNHTDLIDRIIFFDKLESYLKEKVADQ